MLTAHLSVPGGVHDDVVRELTVYMDYRQRWRSSKSQALCMKNAGNNVSTSVYVYIHRNCPSFRCGCNDAGCGYWQSEDEEKLRGWTTHLPRVVRQQLIEQRPPLPRLGWVQFPLPAVAIYKRPEGGRGEYRNIAASAIIKHITHHRMTAGAAWKPSQAPLGVASEEKHSRRPIYNYAQ
jgi:hypothetical protein